MSTMEKAARKKALWVVFLTVFIDLLGFGLVLPLLPIYANEFTSPDADPGMIGLQLGLLMASFSAMQFIFAPFWGRISDRIGRRPVIMVGLAGSVGFYALFGWATVQKSLTWLFIARIGAGICGATISTAQAFIADVTPPEKRSHGMALIGMAFGMGFTFGPLLGLLAVPDGNSDPGPWPGYAAAILSGFALLLAIFYLPESKTEKSQSAAKSMLNISGIRQALGVPTIGIILLSIFLCVFSFANFETTLSLLIKGSDGEKSIGFESSPFQLSWAGVCWTYSFIGFTLLMVQGGVVRRFTGKVADSNLAAFGATTQILGFVIMSLAIKNESVWILYLALATVVTGFSFMQPSLNALLSRRSDPRKQGMILGVGQSTSAMARILGSGLGLPLLGVSLTLPYYLAIGMMFLGVLMVMAAGRKGKDFVTDESQTTTHSQAEPETESEDTETQSE